jgi:hypothetical protein
VALSFVTQRPVEELEAFVRAVVAGVRPRVVVGGALADARGQRVTRAGAHFGESAEDVSDVLHLGPTVRARSREGQRRTLAPAPLRLLHRHSLWPKWHW